MVLFLAAGELLVWMLVLVGLKDPWAGKQGKQGERKAACLVLELCEWGFW